MAKLTEAFMEEGRELVRSKDLPAVMDWAKRSRVHISLDLVESTMRVCFQVDDTDRAIRMLNAGFEGADPTRQVVVGFCKLLWRLCVVAGVLGGALFLVRSCGS